MIMDNTMLIQLTNQKVARLLYELEGLRLIKVLKGEVVATKTKLSDKYRGFITQEEGVQLNNHINQMRNEWDNI